MKLCPEIREPLFLVCSLFCWMAEEEVMKCALSLSARLLPSLMRSASSSEVVLE